MDSLSGNKSGPLTDDFQEKKEPKAVESEYESDLEMMFESDAPVDSETKRKHSNGSQKSSDGSKVARKRRSWELKPKEKAQALNDIRMACRICSKEYGSHNQLSIDSGSKSWFYWSRDIPTECSDFDLLEKEITDLPHWEQNKFEEVLSEHLKTEHDIKDEFYLEKEHIKAIKLRSVLDSICQERHPTAENFIY